MAVMENGLVAMIGLAGLGGFTALALSMEEGLIGKTHAEPALSSTNAAGMSNGAGGPTGEAFSGSGFDGFVGGGTGGGGIGDNGIGDNGIGDNGIGDNGIGDNGIGDNGSGDDGFGSEDVAGTTVAATSELTLSEASDVDGNENESDGRNWFQKVLAQPLVSGVLSFMKRPNDFVHDKFGTGGVLVSGLMFPALSGIVPAALYNYANPNGDREEPTSLVTPEHRGEDQHRGQYKTAEQEIAEQKAFAREAARQKAAEQETAEQKAAEQKAAEQEVAQEEFGTDFGFDLGPDNYDEALPPEGHDPTTAAVDGVEEPSSAPPAEPAGPPQPKQADDPDHVGPSKDKSNEEPPPRQVDPDSPEARLAASLASGDTTAARELLEGMWSSASAMRDDEEGNVKIREAADRIVFALASQEGGYKQSPAFALWLKESLLLGQDPRLTIAIYEQAQKVSGVPEPSFLALEEDVKGIATVLANAQLFEDALQELSNCQGEESCSAKYAAWVHKALDGDETTQPLPLAHGATPGQIARQLRSAMKNSEDFSSDVRSAGTRAALDAVDSAN